MSKVEPGPPEYPPQYPPPPAAAYPAPAGAPPPYQPAPGQSTTVVVAQPYVAPITVFKQHSARIQCPHCHAQVTTSTAYTTGTITWIICLLLCVFGLWFFCCLIPFCIDSCKDVIHTCPNCRMTVGRYSPM